MEITPRHHHHHHHHHHLNSNTHFSSSSPPPKPINRSESTNPYPTTFVQADSSSFKQVVQMLTGSKETAHKASDPNPNPNPSSKSNIPPIKSIPKRQQSSFKLYERRNAINNLRINPLSTVFASSHSHRNPEILSPSMLDFPSLVLSPVTPLIPDPFGRSLMNVNAEAAEDKAIREKGFYLHPSPATTPRESEPQLLSLFPMTSPRDSTGCSSTSD